MGEAGYRRCEQLFSPARFRERLWPLLERLTLLPRSGAETAGPAGRAEG